MAAAGIAPKGQAQRIVQGPPGSGQVAALCVMRGTLATIGLLQALPQTRYNLYVESQLCPIAFSRCEAPRTVGPFFQRTLITRPE